MLLRKPVSYAEVHKDLDDDLANLFRVLRNPDQARQIVGKPKRVNDGA